MDSHFVSNPVSGDVSNGTLGDVPHNTQPCFKHENIISAAAITELKGAVEGHMVVQGQASAGEYQAAIDRWNQNGIKEAAIVVFCESENDISACLRWTKKWGFNVAIAGGRHTFHGASSTYGLVIDMRKMNKVIVDRVGMKVSAQGGCLAEQVEIAAEAEGLLVVFGAVNETGIGGLTLGGGSGWATGEHGHTIDNLLSARVVLANGDVVTASEEENPDLFWGIRGSGSNFGVCSEFTYKAHHQGPVYFGFLIFSPDKMRTCFELVDILYTTAIEPSGGKFQLYLAPMKPPGSPTLCPIFVVFYNGPENEGRAYAAPLLALNPMHNTLAMTNYAATTAIHKTLVPPSAHHRYTSSVAQMGLPLDVDILMSLTEDIDAFLTQYGEAAAPTRLAIELRSFAVTGAVPVSAMAFASRHKLVNVVLEIQYNDASLDAKMREEASRIIGKVRQSVAEKKGEQGQGGVLVNANFSSGYEKLNAVFGENLPRLRELKRKYDPDFIFNKWYPIPPAEA